MSRYLNVNAVVIRKTSSKENDIRVTLITDKLGKIIAIAKGAKNINSSRLGSLQLGNSIKASLYNKNDLYWISESTTISSFQSKNDNLVRYNLLFYILEVINHLTAEQQLVPNLLESLTSTINSINQNNFSDLVKNEIRLLEIQGFGVDPLIRKNYEQKNLKECQKLIKQSFESIIEKPIKSNRLFR